VAAKVARVRIATVLLMVLRRAVLGRGAAGGVGMTLTWEELCGLTA